MDVRIAATPVLGGLRAAHVDPLAWVDLDACPVCTTADQLVPIAFVEGDEPGQSFSGCARCEHIFCRRRPSPSWFGAFYRDSWDAEGRRTTSRPAPEFSGVEFCAPHLAPGARVLDVGGGLGHSALGFRSRGFEVSVAERSAHRADRLEALGFPTVRGAVEDLEPDRPFDLVHLRHVLEHVDDIGAAVTACAGLLAVDGMLYIAVPNWSGEHPLQSFHFVPHLSLFSACSLTALLARAGFGVVEVAQDRELRILARLHGGGAEVAVAPFSDAVTAWVRRAVGPPGPQTLAWWPSGAGDAYYEGRRFVGRASALGADIALRLVARRRGRGGRVLRDAVGLPTAGTLRALRYDVSGDELPLRIRHTGRAPVWVK